MRKRSHVNQLWSHSYVHCVRIAVLHALRRSRRYCKGWTSRYGGWLMGRARKQLCSGAPRCGKMSPREGIRLRRMVLREARGFSTGLCREAVLNRCSLVSSNMVCERSTRYVRLPGACAPHRSRIAQPHGQRRTAVTAKRMTSPYGVMVCPAF